MMSYYYTLGQGILGFFSARATFGRTCARAAVRKWGRTEDEEEEERLTLLASHCPDSGDLIAAGSGQGAGNANAADAAGHAKAQVKR